MSTSGSSQSRPDPGCECGSLCGGDSRECRQGGGTWEGNSQARVATPAQAHWGCSDKGCRPGQSHERAGNLGVYPQLPICPWLMNAQGDLVLWHFCPAPKGLALAETWELFVLRDPSTGRREGRALAASATAKA